MVVEEFSQKWIINILHIFSSLLLEISLSISCSLWLFLSAGSSRLSIGSMTNLIYGSLFLRCCFFFISIFRMSRFWFDTTFLVVNLLLPLSKSHLWWRSLLDCLISFISFRIHLFLLEYFAHTLMLLHVHLSLDAYFLFLKQGFNILPQQSCGSIVGSPSYYLVV